MAKFQTQTVDLGQFDLDAFLAQQRLAMQAPKSKKKQKGFLLDQVSTGGGIGGALAGGAAGAAIGSAVPVVGTAIGGILGALLGGGAGSAAGEVTENVITGDKLDKNVAKEALIGGVTSLPIGAGLKLAQAGVKATTGVGKTGARELIQQAGAKTVPGAMAKTVPEAVLPTTKQAMQTTLPARLKESGKKALASQYGVLSKPTIRNSNPTETVGALADMGLTKPADIERIGQAITGSDGLLNQQVVKAVGGSGRVNTDSVREVFTDALDNYGIVDKDRKSLEAIFKAQMTKLNGGARGAIGKGADPTETLGVIKGLESKIADFRGKGGNYRMSTPEREDMANALQLVRDELQDNLFASAGANKNLQGLLTPELREQLVALAPGNASFAKYVDDVVMKSQDIPTMRSAQRPFVNAGKMIQEGHDNAFSFGGRSVTTGNGVKGAILETLQNVAKNPASRAYAAATRIVPEGAQTAATAATRTNQALLPLAARQVGGRILTTPQGPSQLPEGQVMPSAEFGTVDPMAEMAAQEPSIGGYTKSQIEQAMIKASMDPKGQDAFAQLKALYDMLPESSAPELSAAGQKAIMAGANGENTIDQIEATIAQAGGGSGALGGRIQGITGALGIDHNAKLYEDALGGWLPSISQAQGKTDAPSESELRGLRQQLPMLTDTPEVVAQKIAMLRQRIAMAKQNAMYATANEPTQPY